MSAYRDSPTGFTYTHFCYVKRQTYGDVYWDKQRIFIFSVELLFKYFSHGEVIPLEMPEYELT
jgi:hypothetical protein